MEKTNIKFSIIIPVYNVEQFLSESINSVLDQNYNNYEMILVNDGSSDNSGDICDKYMATDGRIKVIHQMNKGLSVARNTGIKNATGQYIIFLDSDDYWKSQDILAEINDRLTATDSDVLSFDYIKFTEGHFEKSYFETVNCTPLENEDFTLKYQIDRGVWIACAWNKVIKKSLFDKFDLYFREGITSEDIDWCLRLALSAQKFDYINKVVVCYRQRESSISNNITVKKTDVLIDNIDYCIGLLNNVPIGMAEDIKPFIGYQYGTAMYLVSAIADKEQYKRLLTRLEKNKQLLYWSENKKVKLLRMAYTVGGIKFVMMLLKLREKIR